MVRPRHPRPRRWALVTALACVVGVWWVPRPAPATVAEQRARLPPAAECGGERVAGIWRAHKFNPDYEDWVVFDLHIARDRDDRSRLSGIIRNHSWTGGPAQEEPPPCAENPGWEWVVSMDARGTVSDDLEIFFGGVGEWRLDELRCRRGPWGYNLDNLSGTIDPAILEFQSVNNDGGRSVNEPMVFRRIRCPPEEHAQAPSVNPRAPAFYPDTGGGCTFPF
ncbi:MAG: hypothetical protein ACFCGT_08930 [Sandaracinaceae bacterium]